MLIQGSDKISKMIKVQELLQYLPKCSLLSNGTATRLCAEILSEQKASSSVKLITFTVTLSKVFQYHILVQL